MTPGGVWGGSREKGANTSSTTIVNKNESQELGAVRADGGPGTRTREQLAQAAAVILNAWYGSRHKIIASRCLTGHHSQQWKRLGKPRAGGGRRIEI